MGDPQDKNPAGLGAEGRLDGRRALIIGGSGGLGKAAALELGRRGACLVIHGGHSRERLDATLAEASALGAETEGFLHEVGGSPASLSSLVEATLSLGRIDILIVAFGPFVQAPLARTTAADWASTALLDLALPGALASALLPAMASRGWGRVLLFGGTRTDAIRAYSTNAAYAAAKTGLAVLAKSLAAEGAAAGVGCILACPGLADTEYLNEETRRTLRARAPGGRLVQPQDIARAAVGLLAAEPCAASGAILSLDGGLY
jgi:Dehydrogenases with different specificities (related to short-chain alcohol dehydrogenases)